MIKLGDDLDSGCDSIMSDSRDDSPSMRAGTSTASNPRALLEEYEEDYDESLSERLWGLTEMFPDSVRCGVSKLAYGSVNSARTLYSLGRSAAWILFSSSIILVAPLMFEMERLQVEEMHKQQQRQILLGPGAAMSGPSPGMGPPMSPKIM